MVKKRWNKKLWLSNFNFRKRKIWKKRKKEGRFVFNYHTRSPEPNNPPNI